LRGKLLLVVFLVLLAPVAARAGPPGKWTKVTGAGQPNLNIDGLSAARAPNGVLHFVFVRRSGSAGVVQHASLSVNAKALSPPASIFTYPNGADPDPLLLAVPGGLRAFFAGLYPGSALDRGLATATSSTGTAWAVKGSLASHASPPASVYAASGIGGALRKDGTPVTAWGSPGSAAHLGIDPAASDFAYSTGGCCDYDPGIGVDAATGQTVAAWHFIHGGTSGTAARQLLPSGAQVQPPGGGAADNGTTTGITGRLAGKPGVYIAYQQGTNQFLAYPAVWRFGAPRAKRLSSHRGARSVGISPAPEGRLWTFWYQSDGHIYARRSNISATKWGPLRRIAAVGHTQTIYRVTGEGSLGPLDVFGLLDRGGNDLGYWQTRILPVLALRVTKAKLSKTTFKLTVRVTDVGDPVAGAVVKIGGVGAKPTGKSGKVTFIVSPKTYHASATKKWYVPAKAKIRVR
jgi:hypothetical protein